MYRDMCKWGMAKVAIKPSVPFRIGNDLFQHMFE